MIKPKERQFQVVPVPAVFTRGRWECSDFKEANGPDSQILEFNQSSEKYHIPSDLSNCTQSNGFSIPPSQTVAPSTSQFTTSNSQPILNSAANLGLNEASVSPSQSTVTTQGSVTNDYTTNALINLVACESFSSHISEGTMLTNATSAPAAIDNKIEQAMDLVKTHLTFAVREEVELLRSTITDLETKVRILENENRFLRQYAPTEALQNLQTLVQNAHNAPNQQQQLQQPKFQ